MNTGSVTPKLGRRKVFQLLFLQWNSMGCQHLLEWHGLDQSIFSKESQLKPGSKFFKKQSKQKIQFEANFSASLPMSEVKKFSSVSHYLWIAKKENIKSNKHKATNNVAQTNSYDSGCNQKQIQQFMLVSLLSDKVTRKKAPFKILKNSFKIC